MIIKAILTKTVKLFVLLGLPTFYAANAAAKLSKENIFSKADFAVYAPQSLSEPQLKRAWETLSVLKEKGARLKFLKNGASSDLETSRKTLQAKAKSIFGIDYLIEIVADFERSAASPSYFEVTILNKDLEVVFQKRRKKRFSPGDILSFANELYEEARALFYEEGNLLEILPVGEALVKISSNKPAEYFLGSKFHIICRQALCSEVEMEGVFTETKDEAAVGYIYKGKEDYLDVKNFLDRYFVVVEPNYSRGWDSKKMDIDQTTRSIEFNYRYNYSFLSCAVLPITGHFDGDLNKIRDSFLQKMKADGRCRVKNDVNFLNIFNKYKQNINSYVKDSGVLKVFADTLMAGSIFRVTVNKHLMNHRVSLDVIADNGRDILFRERAVIDQGNEEAIADLLRTWMIKYIRGIPYHALVEEAAENEVFFNLGESAVHTNNQAFTVYRPERMTLNRMGLGHTAKWEKKKVGTGLVYKTEEQHSVGKILSEKDFAGRSFIRKGDWVVLSDIDVLKQVKPTFALHNLKKNRQTGRLKLGGNIQAIKTDIKNEEKSADISSISAGAELFLPFSFLFNLEFERFNGEGVDGGLKDGSTYNAGLGYSAILEGSLFVSTVDVYAGYINYFLPLSSVDSIFVGNVNAGGLYASARMEMPLYEKMNFHAGVLASPSMSGEVDDTILGDLKEASYYSLSANVDYKLGRRFSMFVEYFYDSFTFTQEVDDVKTTVNTNKFKLGLYYYF